MKKRLISLVLALTMFLSITSVSLAEGKKEISFKDVKSDAWFTSTVSKLVKMGGIEGYPDGTFRPNNTITTAEFIKITVGSLGYEEIEPKDKHWATNYVKKAEEIGLIDSGEYKESELNKPINRYQMSKILVKAVEHIGEELPGEYKNYEKYIKDFKSVPEEYKDYVLKTYSRELIDGYSNGEFKGNNNLTRAEASTVIVRIFDKTERVNVKDKAKDEAADWIEPEFDVWYSTKNKDEYNYFIFFVDNYKDYEGKGYTFKTECVSHPQLNKWKEWNPIVQKVIDVDNILIFTQKGDDVIKEMGRIYELEDLRDVKGVTLKEGEKLKYKVTITNGKITKTYELSAEFKNKTFRY